MAASGICDIDRLLVQYSGSLVIMYVYRACRADQCSLLSEIMVPVSYGVLLHSGSGIRIDLFEIGLNGLI